MKTNNQVKKWKFQNSENTFIFTTDKKNNLLVNINYSFFRLIKNFQLKHKGTKLNTYNHFTLDYSNSDLINKYIENHFNKVSRMDNKIHTQNNYSYLKNCGDVYTIGTNLFKSGLYSRLKTTGRIYEI